MRGSRPGERRGGRKKGTPNKASAARAASVAATGDTPLDLLLAIMRSPDVDLHIRLDAAKAAAPFVHQRLATVHHAGKDGEPIQVQIEAASDLDIARRIAFALTKGMMALN